MPLGLESPFHLLILLIVVLLVFGAKRLPEMGRSLGTGMRECKDGVVGGNRAEVTSRSDSSWTEHAEDVAKGGAR